MTFSIRTLLIFAVIVACFASAISAVNGLLHSIREAQRGNTVGWVARMAVSHMQANSGSWPRSWDELQDDYKTVVCEFGQPWQFEELRENVQIDWDADLDCLREQLKTGDYNINLVKMRDQPPLQKRVDEANEVIVDYIRNSHLAQQ